MQIIKVGFCVAYDWVYLKRSIPAIYEHADIICLSVDKNRKTWSGTPYRFEEEAFFAFINSIDVQNKIRLYEDDFSLPRLSAMENDTRQRNLMAREMGDGGWHIQIDSDEYFLHFNAFVQHLKSIHINPTGREKSLNVNVCLVPLIKKLSTGYLYVDFKNQIPENLPIATNKPEYVRARNNGHFNMLSPFFAIHETWARDEEDMWFKISNWGHSADELVDPQVKMSYFNFWKSLSEGNYQLAKNLHPAIPAAWPALSFHRAQSIEELMSTFKAPKFPLTPFQLRLRNNRQIARVKALIDRIF